MAVTLAAGERAGKLPVALLQAGEELIHPLDILFDLFLILAQVGADLEVFEYGHVREHAPSLGNLRDARGENGVDGLAEQLLVVVGDGAGLGLDKAGDGTQRGGFARAVRADEGDDLAVGHLHVNAAQRLNAAVGDLKVLNFKHPLPPPDRRR